MNINTYNIYYVQVNVMCILLLLYIYYMYSKEMKDAVEAIYYKTLLIECGIYCVCDIVAAVCKKMTFSGVRSVLYIANMLYVAWPLLLIVSWGKYVSIRMQRWGYKQTKLEKAIVIGLLTFFAFNFLTPVTGYIFYLDEQNMYHRSIGSYINYILCILYNLYVTMKIIRLKAHMHSAAGRESAKILILFIILPYIGSFIQIMIYGCTCAQVGLTFGFLFVYLLNQQIKISRDELTGLNNRREYEMYMSDLEKNGKYLWLCMIDVDKFKQINDSYGHKEGDRALKIVATSLRNACNKCYDHLFLARYGGDEFVIIADEEIEKLENKLCKAIFAELEEKNNKEDLPYKLCVSVGMASGKVQSAQEIKDILERADQKMYEYKKTIQKSNAN